MPPISDVPLHSSETMLCATSGLGSGGEAVQFYGPQSGGLRLSFVRHNCNMPSPNCHRLLFCVAGGRVSFDVLDESTKLWHDLMAARMIEKYPRSDWREGI
jgi:hypothetical protein